MKHYSLIPEFQSVPFEHDAVAYSIKGVQEGYRVREKHYNFYWLPYMFETRVGKGRIFACMLNLNIDILLGRALAKNIVSYIKSSSFKPKASTCFEKIAGIKKNNLAEQCPLYCQTDKFPDRLESRISPNARFTLLYFNRGNRGKYDSDEERIIFKASFDSTDNYPKSVFLDLQQKVCAKFIVIHNTSLGNTKRIKISIGKSDSDIRQIGQVEFPRMKYRPKEILCSGMEFRIIKIDFLDSYQDSQEYPPHCMLLRGVEVR